jgi:hypothetical protein
VHLLVGVASEGVDSVAEAESVVLESLSRLVVVVVVFLFEPSFCSP